MTFQKNQVYTVKIEDIGTEGEGIGKIEGFSLFVKDALPGDVAKVRLTKVKKNYAYARLEEILEPSPDRVKPPCAFHRQCGGCQIQALSYEKQLSFKQEKVENNLIRIGGFAPEKIRQIMEPAIGMKEPWHYRNKAQYPFGYSREGEIVTGFYAGRTHSIIANTDCLIGAPENKKILEVILQHMEQYHVTAYDEKTGQGLVRHVLIRKGFSTGELMVCIVINTEEKSPADRRTGKENAGREKEENSGKTNFCRDYGRKWIPEQNKLVDKLAMVRGMTSISVNLNHENTNVIMGEKTYTIWGKDKIKDKMHLLQAEGEDFVKTGKSVMYEISPRSFYQVNSAQAEKLYSTALSYAGLTGKETVWDLYCGIGTISLFLAQGAKQVYGVEVIPEAIEDARENARKNGIENVRFFVGKAEEILPEFYETQKEQGGNGDGKGLEVSERGNNEWREGVGGNDEGRRDGKAWDMSHPDVIVVDPPRKGCDVACLNTILKMKPERVVYVSCDSATLARDLKILCAGGYELKRGRVCDQFCQSVHVETVVLLSQRKADDYVEVELELDEFDVTSAESKAIYAEIKDYVLKEYGLKVSNLYIAQVKRKCGIEVGENYNLPKSEGARGPVDLCSARTGAAAETARQPQCPVEKEKAIKDALEHFGMI